MSYIGIKLHEDKIITIEDYIDEDVHMYSILADSKGNTFWLSPTDFTKHVSLMEKISNYLSQSNGLGYLLNEVENESKLFINGNILQHLGRIHGKYIEFMNTDKQIESLTHTIDTEEDIEFYIDMPNFSDKVKEYKFKISLENASISEIDRCDNVYTVEYIVSYIEISHGDSREFISYPSDSGIKLRVYKDKVRFTSSIRALILKVMYGD